MHHQTSSEWLRINEFEYQIGNAMKVRDFLFSAGYTRSVLVTMKRIKPAVFKNGMPVFMNDTLAPGDCLTVRVPEEKSASEIHPRALDFSILFEDRDLLVVNKPADMPIHPSIGNYENTLANAVAYYMAQKGEPIVFRCINRLDKDTTGLVIVAKHLLAASILNKAMAERKIIRIYTAAVEGEMPESGRITLPIARKEGSVIERCIDPMNGEAAITDFRTLEIAPDLASSLIECRLQTGRTHQIRVHMAGIGHPLLGDGLYGTEGSGGMPRQALHAGYLSFAHPMTRERLTFEAPLPADFEALKH